MTKAIALIPARGGSKRIPKKNVRLLAGHPLLAYTVCAALDSGCFEKVLVSSDDPEILSVAARYGADCLRRPDEFATDTSPDIGFVRHALEAVSITHSFNPLEHGTIPFDTFSILRPTSPFRSVHTIQGAMSLWMDTARHHFDSLRAMEKISQHPGKAWQIFGDRAVPLLMQPQGQPWHDSQYASLPPVYVQTAALEIAHVKTVIETGTISGKRVYPFFFDLEGTQTCESLDVNTERDWALAEYLIDRGDAKLPEVRERVNA